jgi:DMSO reductase family type II enzyme heme b subunit
VVAEGLGTTRATESQPILARSAYAHGVWTVVLARDLAAGAGAGETARLAGGTSVEIGFAVWEGGNGERGGVKSYSREWRRLAIE